MTRTKKSAALLKILVIAAILILLPIVTPNMYIMQIINMIGIYIILGIGINVLTGYTGQLSLGLKILYTESHNTSYASLPLVRNKNRSRR